MHILKKGKRGGEQAASWSCIIQGTNESLKQYIKTGIETNFI